MADCSVASEFEDECLFEPFHYFKAAFGLLDPKWDRQQATRSSSRESRYYLWLCRLEFVEVYDQLPGEVLKSSDNTLDGPGSASYKDTSTELRQISIAA